MACVSIASVDKRCYRTSFNHSLLVHGMRLYRICRQEMRSHGHSLPVTSTQYARTCVCVYEMHSHGHSLPAIHYQSLPVTITHFHSLPVTSTHFHSLPVTSTQYQSLPVTSTHFHSLPVTADTRVYVEHRFTIRPERARAQWHGRTSTVVRQCVDQLGQHGS